MMKKIFLAIKIPVSPDFKAQIDSIHRNFNFMKTRWVEPKYMHLTLKYFGPTNEKTIKRITKIIDDFSISQSSFSLTINKLSMFGSKGSPRVLWLGIEEEELLNSIFVELQKKINKIGLYADRQNFVPHISIGRIIKTNSNSFFQKQLHKSKDFPHCQIDINSITLYESVISQSGVEYRIIKEFGF